MFVFAVATDLEAAGQKANILFIAVDDLRPELGCYGAPVVKTPNIDRLAAEGVLFERNYCQFSHCAPSRASVFSGLRPGGPRTGRQPELPELFKRNGYHCEAMGKVYHGSFGPDIDPPGWRHDEVWSVPVWFPLPRFYFSPDGIAEAKRVFAQNAKNKGVPLEEWSQHKVKGYATDCAEVNDFTYKDGQIVERAISRLDAIGDQPFFLAVGLMSTHLPFQAPTKYWNLYDRKTLRLPDNRFHPKGSPEYSIIPLFELGQYTDSRKMHDRSQWPIIGKRLMHGYLAATSYVDALVGQLLEALDARGLRENTVVVLWGDNGYKLGEHAAWSKFSNFELDTQVPLIISAPEGVLQGRVGLPTESLDIYPTLCELAGLPVPPDTQGESLVPYLTNPQHKGKAVACSMMKRNMSGGNKTDGTGYALRDERYRLVVWIKDKDKEAFLKNPRPDSPYIKDIELYDHRNDPQENVNTASNPENREVVARLIRRMAAVCLTGI
jgi:arylsulfatase A-like enzyme